MTLVIINIKMNKIPFDLDDIFYKKRIIDFHLYLCIVFFIFFFYRVQFESRNAG